MSSPDAEVIRRLLNEPVRERLAHIEAFSEIDSTNSYLMQLPGPEPGRLSVAVTSNQTSGRGRHGKTWQSPPESGLCLSLAYTFRTQPDKLPALTLAIGLGAIDALQELGAGGVELKWPNDLVAVDAKLGGILTEVHQQSAGAVTVVTGIGVNVDLQSKLDPTDESDWVLKAIDLKRICDVVPNLEALASQLIASMLHVLVDFETSGFVATADRWPRYDWLFGRDITVDIANGEISGVGAGVADDGALLVDTGKSGVQRVTSGSIVMAGAKKTPQ